VQIKKKIKYKTPKKVPANSPGNPWSQSRRRKREGYGGKDLWKRKILSLDSKE